MEEDDFVGKKIKNYAVKIGGLLFMLCVGFACGFLMAGYMDSSGLTGGSKGKSVLSWILLFAGLYLGIFLQTVIHEAGHLVFGLLTGYRFSSFRIGSFMWVMEEGKLHFCRLNVAGTGGQCLMLPPDMDGDKLPVVWYNLGGSLMNIIVSVLLLLSLLLVERGSFAETIILIIAVIGIVFALINGIPLHAGLVDNDGYNAVSLCKDKKARRAFWIQMKFVEETARGTRMKDMPGEWFAAPADEDMKNSMVAAIGVFACNRLMDEHRFAEADRLMEHCLEIESGIVGLHRSMLVCDRMYCELVGQNRPEVLEQLYTKEQKKFMKSMKKFPSVLRTEYACALLAEKDETKAEKIRGEFEKNAKTYPYAVDIESERELMERAVLAYREMSAAYKCICGL